LDGFGVLVGLADSSRGASIVIDHTVKTSMQMIAQIASILIKYGQT
jgi:hypothetical protein